MKDLIRSFETAYIGQYTSVVHADVCLKDNHSRMRVVTHTHLRAQSQYEFAWLGIYMVRAYCAKCVDTEKSDCVSGSHPRTRIPAPDLKFMVHQVTRRDIAQAKGNYRGSSRGAWCRHRLL